ncbi:hypothetical protein, partial [Aquimarina litoralis]|uniref:hypothetical protein n=1 Tax=Aquimarina litoralis TaxID=584605 RepID=UPI001C5839C7
CSSQNNITLVDPTQVTASATQNAYSCAADNSDVFPDITVTIVDGTPDYTISYTGPGITVTNLPVVDADAVTPGVQFIIDADVAGNYDITVMDSNNCPFVVPTVVVPPFPAITGETVVRDATAVNAGAISCDNPETVIVSVADDGLGTGDYIFEVLETGVVVDTPLLDFDAQFTLPAVGIYTFEITDERTGCSVTTTYEVLPFDTIAATLTLVTDNVCFGDALGELNLNITGYTGTYNYTVTNTITSGVAATGSGDTTAANPLLIGSLPAGTYEVSVEALDSPFCDETSNTATISEPSDITFMVDQENANCNTGGIVTIVADGGTPPYTYIADDGVNPIITNTDGNFVLTDPTGTGTNYTITVRDNNNCTETSVITVNTTANPVLDPIQAFVDDPCTFDNNYTFTVTASGFGQLTYQLDAGVPVPGNVSNTEHQFTVTGPGTYTVTVYDGNNCPSNQETITVYPELIVSADFSVEPTCRDFNGDITVTVSGGSDFATNPGNFTFVLTGTDSASAAVGPITQNGAGGNVFTGLSVGSYSIVVTDSGIAPAPGCDATATVTREIPTDPTVALTGDNPNCVGSSDGSILVTTPVGTDIPYTYQLFDFTGSV